MGSSRGIGAIASGIALAGIGAGALAAWQHGLWGTLTGAMLAITWLLALGWWAAMRPRRDPTARSAQSGAEEGVTLRLLLDQVPVPLLSQDAGAVRALNRAARALFATDDRVLPAPDALADPAAAHLLHEGRRWRIDRVELHGAAVRTIVALIDIEAEERSAEARATADMIQILGHELLNGLAPIVSLAESGLAALATPARADALLPEILGTLARRADGLLRFSEAYRTLARMPAPERAPVRLAALAEDLDRLFQARWGDVVTLRTGGSDGVASIDRAQITQAIWALLQNGAEAAIAAAAPRHVSLILRQDGDTLLAEVADSGAGIEPANATRIFRPFHTTKPDGTGVGLSLARHVALTHGGELALVAQRPATFRMRLPS